MATRPRTSRKRAAPKLAEYRKMRDFGRTREPRGADPVPGTTALAFVVQKHAARHLHFDLRLEVDGVMKSWAVPKGPSLQPREKRLAVEVEDHPVEYNTFEGTIPQGEYGGGTVMLWDRGSYTVDDLDAGGDAAAAMRLGLAEGKISVTLHGERLQGSFALVRTRRSDAGKPQWLLFKHDDAHAAPSRDVAAEWTASVESGRSMEEIARGDGARAPRPGRNGTRPAPGRSVSAHLASFSPMLATAMQAAPEGESWTFEPKWDGIRIVAFAAPDGVALVTRNGNDKRIQFPEVAEALREMAHALGEAFIVDGELVGMRDGEIVRFESLQARMHVGDAASARSLAAEDPAAFVAFDLLLQDEEVLLNEEWAVRRRALEAVLESRQTDIIRLGETSADRAAMVRRAGVDGWEGLIAKRTTSTYAPGARSKNWLKIKLENRQEFVVGGWTEPRGSRPYFGALLLGHYDASGRLVYAGHTGTGFTQDALRDLHRRLQRLERKTSPFTTTPETNQAPHWTTPRVVVDVRFNEWTRTGVLRQPVFVGLREDKDPREVVRESAGPGTESEDSALPSASQQADHGTANGAARPSLGGPVVEQLTAMEREGGEGTLRMGKRKVDVTNLRKVFYPKESLTKGDLLRYYAAMAPCILPHTKERPLVLKRFPNGIGGEAFYQQSPAGKVPDGVRVEVLEAGADEAQRRIVGGDLVTLLYTIQLGAISYDPWHSRIGSLEYADYTILDLDPGPATDFATVVEVARKVKEELDRAGLHGALKTSGSTGLHIYLPLPPRTPLEAARLVAEIVATRVATRHPDIATVERMTKRRSKGTVYVDFLQNILGKTVAGVYAVRAKPGATVSTPLRWDELTDDLDLRAFTIRTVPERVSEIGDLWSGAMKKRNSLKRLMGGGAAPARS